MNPERVLYNLEYTESVMKSFEYCVFIGKFQPFTLSDFLFLQNAFTQAKTVIIVIGSHNKAPDIENPWSSPQREEMIRSSLTSNEQQRVKFVYVRDSYYVQNKWLIEVQQQVASLTNNCKNNNICFIGEENQFPQWAHITLFNEKTHIHHFNENRFLNGLEIRNNYFRDTSVKVHVPPAVADYLEKFKQTPLFQDLKASFEYIENYKKQWEVKVKVPFPVQFLTVDCVCLKSGNILVVRRKGHPGKGQIALPGGFLNPTETLEDGALRELKEETSIKISKDILRSSIVESKVYDYPYRSLRGRTLTTAFLIDLGTGALPSVKGSDDAEKAFWLPLNDFVNRENEFFEDHWHIIDSMISKI